MPWIAQREMKVKRGSKHVTVQPGDEVPEADSWKNPKAWEPKWVRWFETKAEAEEGAKAVREKLGVAPASTMKKATVKKKTSKKKKATKKAAGAKKITGKKKTSKKKKTTKKKTTSKKEN